ncbi:MAG: PBP1A family penicillin-binding protein [Methylococcales bacterium]|nr:PBP1A family penicillin-binding protein [Candidatus Moranbacteria bacterium]MCK4841289.1 PBP1A family penicillin-binding protein [Methylococcales bacterium]
MKLNFNKLKSKSQSFFKKKESSKLGTIKLEKTKQTTKEKSKKTKKKGEKQNSKWKIFFKIIGFIASTSIDLILVVALAGATVFLYAYYNTVDAEALVKMDIYETTIIYDKTGEHILYELHGEEDRKVVNHNDISDYMRNATIAAEDDDFYKHIGIDIYGILRAAHKNFIKKENSQGGSTITQQLVRNTFLTREKTYQRKFKEIVLAIKIERYFEKDQILDYYLNEVPYGSNAYGVQSASEVFFGKNASELTLDEAALLASLPKATYDFSPYAENTDRLIERQRYILNRMADLEMYDKEIVNEALATNTLGKLKAHKETIQAPHFVFYVKEQLTKIFGEERVQQGGFKVYTTLDYEMQKRAEQDVKDYAVELPKHGASNAALVAIDPKSGGVLAMVGSVDYFDAENDGEVNVTLSKRQPGSSFKPIVYAAAFDKGYQPETLLYDVPTNFGEDGSGNEYKPSNYDGKNHGLVSMRKALAGSLNTPAVKTLYLVGIDESIDFAEELGITTLKDRSRFGLSLVLGSGEVKLLEEVGAFSVFANDGVKAPVHGISRVVDSSDEEIVHPPESERVINADVARKINSILSDNDARTYVFGKKNNLYFPERKVAAKTGTTQEARDVLTLGYTPDLAVGVWVGNNENKPLKKGSLGSQVAAPLWRKFIERELESLPDTQFEDYEPNTSVHSMVTGKLGGSISQGGAVYYNKKTGERISVDKARKMDASKLQKRYTQSFGHSILYYVNRDNPLDPTAKPDYSDEMLWRWEKALGYSGRRK